MTMTTALFHFHAASSCSLHPTKHTKCSPRPQPHVATRRPRPRPRPPVALPITKLQSSSTSTPTLPQPPPPPKTDIDTIEPDTNDTTNNATISQPRRRRGINKIIGKLRYILLGKQAIRRELYRTAGKPRLQIAITRSIVIFADYLADLSVLDLISDVYQSSTHINTCLLTISGLSLGIFIADFISGLCKYTTKTYATRTAFSTTTTGDVFEMLVNSCFCITPLLCLSVSWSMESGDVFAESCSVTTLALLALLPLLTPDEGGEEHIGVLSILRSIGFLKKSMGIGWAQICGFSDPLLYVVVPFLDRLLNSNQFLLLHRRFDVGDRRFDE